MTDDEIVEALKEMWFYGIEESDGQILIQHCQTVRVYSFHTVVGGRCERIANAIRIHELAAKAIERLTKERDEART